MLWWTCRSYSERRESNFCMFAWYALCCVFVVYFHFIIIECQCLSCEQQVSGREEESGMVKCAKADVLFACASCCLLIRRSLQLVTWLEYLRMQSGVVTQFWLLLRTLSKRPWLHWLSTSCVVLWRWQQSKLQGLESGRASIWMTLLF